MVITAQSQTTQSLKQSLVNKQNSEYKIAEILAKRKLARIIEREGDANGERLKPYYLAQLIAETLSSMRISDYLIHNAQTREIKKEMPVAEATGQI